MRRRHAMPFGAELVDGGVRFALWAPSAASVDLVLDGSARPMPPGAGGWRALTVPGVGAGARYAYRIDGGTIVPDPASRCQPDDVAGPSLVVDPMAYDWQDGDWRGRPWAETVLYEAHVGTATPEGTYAGLERRLADLRDLGVTAIELMPLGDFPGGRNWGYDGVLPYAPARAYGAPDDLKRLIDRAHALGLMVFVDAVYNHFGPSGNYLSLYAGSFFTARHHTPWGAGPNFDGAGSAAVRDFFVHNALYWLEEFHADGLRLDAVHTMLDDSDRHILAEIALRVRAACPDRDVHLVLENDRNESRWLTRQGGDGEPRLYTAQWSDDIHHCWHAALTGEAGGYYADFTGDIVEHLGRALAEGFAYQGEPSTYRGAGRGEPSSHLPPTAFVAFLQNHDQIGNRPLGERLDRMVEPRRLALARAALLLAPQVPLLFMGEEWAASAPFLFFVDFAADPALSDAVREGRRREFAPFFAAVGPAAEPPDPTAADCFARSRLDWNERSRAPHAAVLAETRALLALRHAEIMPLLAGRFLGAMRGHPAPGMIDVAWRFEAGILRLVMNFGANDAAVMVHRGDRIVWSSPGVRTHGDLARLGPWAGILFRGADHG
jgi:maltooligosyltrehalose trehalohydrolase